MKRATRTLVIMNTLMAVMLLGACSVDDKALDEDSGVTVEDPTLTTTEETSETTTGTTTTTTTTGTSTTSSTGTSTGTTSTGPTPTGGSGGTG